MLHPSIWCLEKEEDLSWRRNISFLPYCNTIELEHFKKIQDLSDIERHLKICCFQNYPGVKKKLCLFACFCVRVHRQKYRMNKFYGNCKNVVITFNSRRGNVLLITFNLQSQLPSIHVSEWITLSAHYTACNCKHVVGQ